jgi:hypothetical protein
MHVLFFLQLAALDLALRGAPFYLAHPRAIAYLVASAALLHLAASLSGPRPARIAAAIFIGAGVTAQAAFFRYFHAPLDDQGAIAARLAWADVRPMLVAALPALALAALALSAIEYAWLSRFPPRAPRRRLAALALGVGVVVGGPLRWGTTEIRTASAAASFALAAPARTSAAHRALPPLVSRRARVPNVLFVITESVRASDWCGDPAAPCDLAPETHAMLPARVPLLELRTASSYTAISLSVLLTGLPQLGPRAPIAGAPDLFDLVRATRADGRPVGMHYWSAQSPAFFERADVATAVDSYVTADTFLGHVTDDIGEAVYGGLDRRLADECRTRFPALAPPYVVVAHFSGTHAPYFFDEARAKYRPYGETVNFSTLPLVRNAYLNSIMEQDRSIAACVRAFLDAQRGAPHLVLFTSDHGEAFGEHSAIHHGQNFYDEQIHVPGFAFASPGALAPEEERALAGARSAYVTHFDLLPTILDALGVLDHFAIARDRARMPGRSLLRPPPDHEAPVPVTNCSELWQCPLDTWGMLAQDRKLIAQAWDGGWRCVSVRGGEHEEDLARCADLVGASRAFFEKKPNGAPNE